MEAAKQTKYYRKTASTNPFIHRAERLRYVLNNKTAKVYPQELLVEQLYRQRVAGQIWEEHYGVLYILFLHKINKSNPFLSNVLGKKDCISIFAYSLLR